MYNIVNDTKLRVWDGKTGGIEFCGEGKAWIKYGKFEESPNSQTTSLCIQYSLFKWT